MRNLNALDDYRLTGPDIERIFGGTGDDTCGAFAVASPIDGARLRILASADLGWDHVSVSRQNRCPNWPEMELVASMFFMPDEAAFQLHVPAVEHINNHPYTLHWWRPHHVEIPRPPGMMVGVAGLGPDEVREAMNELRTKQG